MEVALGEVAAMAQGRINVISIDEREYAVVRWGDDVYVVRNRCPHQMADLCAGQVGGLLQATNRKLEVNADQPVLACPWHGWEFDLQTGRSAWGDSRWRLWSKTATIRDGVAYLQMAKRERQE